MCKYLWWWLLHGSWSLCKMLTHLHPMCITDELHGMCKRIAITKRRMSNNVRSRVRYVIKPYCIWCWKSYGFDFGFCNGISNIICQHTHTHTHIRKRNIRTNVLYSSARTTHSIPVMHFRLECFALRWKGKRNVGNRCHTHRETHSAKK